MHLKLDADTPLAVAHEVAERIESALRQGSSVAEVQTHLEPLELPLRVEAPRADEGQGESIAQLVARRTGQPPRHLRLLSTRLGVVVFVDVVARPDATLSTAHDLARRLEEEIRGSRQRVADVVVHTEP
jgi:divalent metal cation (Fe/Co/Zn/Cd) transporter